MVITITTVTVGCKGVMVTLVSMVPSSERA